MYWTCRVPLRNEENANCFFFSWKIAWPLADAALTQEILDLLQSATHIRQSKKGANEGKNPNYVEACHV